jgi:LPS-assembly protein
MSKSLPAVLIISALLLSTPEPARAQVTDIPGFDRVLAQITELVGKRYVLREAVEMTQGDMKFYADYVEYYGDTNRLIATGNVLVIEKDHQIAADRADFNAQTRLGTFFNARGFATLGAPTTQDVSTFGTLDPDVQFYGETLEKTGIDTYVISNGGFTSCAQANPRWEMTSGSLKLRVDRYALLRNMLLKVKGVPALYLPIMYYPLSKDNRNTGILMPSYGSSTVKGQTISNAFFWAISRSQDATFLHDWYSKTGQSVAGEYRYVSLGGSGNMRTDFLSERPTRYVSADGDEITSPGRQSFRAFGNMSQGLGGGWYAQGQADYSSDLAVDQLYATDITRASRRTRNYGGSVSGTVRGLRVSGRFDRQEYFAENGTSSLRGNTPRLSLVRPDRLLGGLPVYFSVNTEYLRLTQRYYDENRRATKDDIDRIDIAPAIRFPFTKLPFMAFNTTAQFRSTFWSDSLAFDPDEPSARAARVSAPISRRFLEVTGDVTGPTLVRIFDAPKSTYAQRFRHSLEPFVQVRYLTPIDNYDLIPKFEGTDYIVGNATTVSYGMNTRFYAKRTVDGPRAIPREVISAQIKQRYNTDARSIRSDATDRSRNIDPVSKFSAVNLSVRSSPFNGVNSTFRTDFDGRYSRFKQFSADASWEQERVSLLAGWSNYRFSPDRQGRNVARQTHFFNSSTTLRFQQNRYGIVHHLNYDVKSQSVLQQRISGYYNAQCCGFSAEYQMFDLSRLGNAPVPQDSRFHFSVTLGGIGNVSNIFGALGGTSNR